MPRLALLFSGPQSVSAGSGTAVAIRETLRALEEHGWETTVLTPRTPSRVALTYTRWRFNRSLRLTDLRGADVVMGVDGDGYRVAGTLAVPYVALLKAVFADVLAFERGAVRQLMRLQSRWERIATRRATAVVVASAYAREQVARHYGAELRPKTHVIADPFDAGAWHRRLPPRHAGPPTVLCVAHLYPRKRVDDLLEAWPLVLRALPQAQLRIVGGGPELARLSERATALAQCRVLGHLPLAQLRQEYADAAAFCLPSAQENFGLAVLEAMATGLPLVVANAGALPELTEGAVAHIVPVGEAESIAAALVDCLDEERRSQAAAINPLIAARHPPGDTAGALLGLFASLGVGAAAGATPTRPVTAI